MADIVTIAGSPSASSRSKAVLDYIQGVLQTHRFATKAISVRDFDAQDLLFANFNSPQIKASVDQIAQSKAVIIATPVYKAAYSGVLKVYLDLLPPNALQDKIVLPLATGGSLAHLLAIDYSLKPVLSALGACHILQTVYLVDTQITYTPGQPVVLAEEAEQRLLSALETLTHELTQDKLAILAS